MSSPDTTLNSVTWLWTSYNKEHFLLRLLLIPTLCFQYVKHALALYMYKQNRTAPLQIQEEKEKAPSERAFTETVGY